MYRAYVKENWRADGIDIFVVLKPDGGSPTHLMGQDGNMEVLEEGVSYSQPTLTLHESAARSLLDELLRHFQGATDLHTVRGDLLHERGRVDMLVGKLIELASRPQELHVHKAEQ